jgi:hypothetical protein
MLEDCADEGNPAYTSLRYQAAAVVSPKLFAPLKAVLIARVSIKSKPCAALEYAPKRNAK